MSTTYVSPFSAPALSPPPIRELPAAPAPADVDEVIHEVTVTPITAPVESAAVARMGLDVTVDAYLLKQALTRLKPAKTTRNGALPQLNCAKAVATGGHVHLTMSDLELTLQTSIAQSDGLVGEGLLPFAGVLNVLAKTTAKNTGPIRLSIEDGSTLLTIERGRLTTNLHSHPVDEYPRLREQPAREGCPLLLDQFGELARAASTNDARPILTGVYIDNRCMVATDSYRLHVIDDLDLGLPDGVSILVPARAMKVLAKIGGPAVMVPADDGRSVAFWTEDLLLVTVCIEGEFPNWRGLVPTDERPGTAWFDLVEMREAVAECNRLVGGSAAPMRIGIDAEGSLHVRRAEQDVIDVTIKLAGGTTGTWADAETAIAVNGVYFADMISDVTSNVLRGVDGLKPALIVEDHPLGGTRKRLIMPVRV